MKNIKDIIIGFLLATCMFLFMGQAKPIANKMGIVGKYSISGLSENHVARINTITGQIQRIELNSGTVDYIYPQKSK